MSKVLTKKLVLLLLLFLTLSNTATAFLRKLSSKEFESATTLASQVIKAGHRDRLIKDFVYGKKECRVTFLLPYWAIVYFYVSPYIEQEKEYFPTDLVNNKNLICKIEIELELDSIPKDTVNSYIETDSFTVMPNYKECETNWKKTPTGYEIVCWHYYSTEKIPDTGVIKLLVEAAGKNYRFEISMDDYQL